VLNKYGSEFIPQQFNRIEVRKTKYASAYVNKIYELNLALTGVANVLMFRS
jgi:hypothetical protein